jgi:1,4-alpha-glucan branching enzyme
MTRGYLALVLHAHLPFVRHPEHRFFLEEDWLYEAITETYIPLLHAFEAMAADGASFKVTLSMSPPLVSMLADELMQQRYWSYLTRLRELIGKELVRNRDHGHLLYLANHYRERIDAAIDTWQYLGGNLVGAFAKLQDRGHLDILTCAATHGYLPLMQIHPEAVRAQIKVGVESHTEHFGRPPSGIWLPECGYYPGLDVILADAGLRYFVSDTHALLLARPRPQYGAYLPVFSSDSGVAAFGRDMESSLQVWNRDHGYPGDPVYREFYRDIGYDLGQEYISPYVQPNGLRKNTGIKYHRITGQTEQKALYDPYWAQEKAAEHGANFMHNRQRQIEHLAQEIGRPPIVVSPYDAELFGHWWYEGPWWLEAVLRKSLGDQELFELVHLAGYLRQHPTHQLCKLAQSSWGDRGFHEFWLNSTNEWIYPHLHKAAEEMIALANDFPREHQSLRQRALNQAARELLLAQSSDWAFIMRTGTMVDYAVRRTRSHLRRFTRLREQIRSGSMDEIWIERVEYADNIFPNLDYRVYATRD